MIVYFSNVTLRHSRTTSAFDRCYFFGIFFLPELSSRDDVIDGGGGGASFLLRLIARTGADRTWARVAPRRGRYEWSRGLRRRRRIFYRFARPYDTAAGRGGPAGELINGSRETAHHTRRRRRRRNRAVDYKSRTHPHPRPPPRRTPRGSLIIKRRRVELPRPY